MCVGMGVGEIQPPFCHLWYITHCNQTKSSVPRRCFGDGGCIVSVVNHRTRTIIHNFLNGLEQTYSRLQSQTWSWPPSKRSWICCLIRIRKNNAVGHDWRKIITPRLFCSRSPFLQNGVIRWSLDSQGGDGPFSVNWLDDKLPLYPAKKTIFRMNSNLTCNRAAVVLYA